MTEIEAIPTALRRSKRISHKIKDNDWSALDFISADSLSTMAKRDELTGRGFVHYIEDITFIEFETLENMKLYDSVAEKMGNICCASFSEFSRPFRGFSEEECSNLNYHYLLFKELAHMDYNQNDAPNVDKDISKKIDRSSKKSLYECKKLRSIGIFRESSRCEPHGKLSCNPCSAAAKSHNPKLSELGLITSVTSPSNSFKVSCVNSELINIDDLMLTSVDSPASTVQELHRSKMTPLMCISYHTRSIDVSTIPFIYRCFAFGDCHNSSACANASSSSSFTLYIKLTAGKGRALTRFAIEYLDQYKANQESNTIDRVTATIAASAVDLSASTMLLPLNKNLISNLFPHSNTLQSLESGIPCRHMVTPPNGKAYSSINIGEQSECSEVEKSAVCPPTSTPEVFETLMDPKRLGLLQSTVRKKSTNVDLSNVCADPLDPINSTVPHLSVDNGEVLCSESPRKRRNGTLYVSPAPQKKRFLKCYTNATHGRFFGISKNDSKTPKSVTNSDNVAKLRSILKPSPLKSKHLEQSGGITVTDSVLARTGKASEKASDSEPSSSDELYPRIVSTTSLHFLSKTRLTATTLDDGPSQCKKQMSAYEGCCFHSNLENVKTPENKGCYCTVRGVIDLTASENEASLEHDIIVQHQGKTKKRKRPPFPHSLQSEKVIVIDDDPYENQNELDPLTSVAGNSFGTSSSLGPLIVTSVHNPIISSVLNTNEQLIDLTGCSEIDVTQRHALTEQRPSQNVSFTSNSLEKVVDLTVGDELQTPTVVTTEEELFSANVDTGPCIDDISNERRTVTTKSVEISNHKEVFENREKSFVGLQKLAVMCNTAPALGFIRVLRCPTGELMLNETFTARVYKHFKDLKALNTYLNQRFEKMPGVKNQGPLEWILATAGVVKLKKVRPLNPKVWFHPNDYVLAKDGPDDYLEVLPSNIPKTKSILGKTQSSSSSYKDFTIPQAMRNMVGEFAKRLQVNGCLIPVIKGSSTTNLPDSYDNKPETSRFVSGSSNKKHIQHLDPAFSKNIQIYLNNAAADTKVMKLNKTISSDSLNIKQSVLPKNEVTQPCGQVSTDVHVSPQPKALAQRMAVLLEKRSNHIPYVKNTTQPTAIHLNGSTQSSNPPSNEVQNGTHGKSSISQNCKVFIGNRASQLPTNITQNNVLSNHQSVVFLNNYHNSSEANQDSMQRSINSMPRSSQVVQTISLNKDTTSVQTKAQPNLLNKVYLKTLNKSNGAQSVVLLPIKQVGQVINKGSSCNLDNWSTLQKQKVLSNNQAKGSVQGNVVAQVRTCQNFTLPLNCQTSTASKVHQYKVSSSNTLRTSQTARSVAPLSRIELTKTSSYENTSIPKPMAVLLNGPASQATMAHQCKVPSTNTRGTLHTAQTVAFVSNNELGASTNQESLSTQPVIVWVNNQSGEETWGKILPHPSNSQTPLLVSNGHPILANYSPSSTIQSPPKTVDSVAQVPDKRIGQPIIQMSQTDLRSSHRTENVTVNDPTAPQKVNIVSLSPMTPPIKFIPLTTSNTQSSTMSNMTAVQMTHARKYPNQSEQKTEKTGYTDAMIYFSSEGENKKGIPVQKFPLIVSKINSNSVDTPKLAVAASSWSSNIVSPSNNKPVNFVRKQNLPMKLYSTPNKDKPPLKLHWTTLNMQKEPQGH